MTHRLCARVILTILVSGVAPAHAWAEAMVIGTVSISPLSGSAPGGTSTLDVKTGGKEIMDKYNEGATLLARTKR